MTTQEHFNPKNLISERAVNISPSATLTISAMTKELKKQGKDVIDLSAGQPDIGTPENVKEAGIKAIMEERTKYTPVGGIPELKKAIIDKFNKDNGLEYNPDEIIVGCGAKHILYSAFQALLNPGDEAILPLPYWVSYIEQVKMAGGKPVFLDISEDITEKDVLNLVTDKTKIILINSPGNPSGRVLEKEELQSIGNVAEKKGLIVLSDEIYEKMIYGKEHFSIASFSDQLKEITLTINGVSKECSMTGWRIGYAAGNKDIIKAMEKINSHSTSNPCSIAQYASIEAITNTETFSKMLAEKLEKRREVLIKEVTKIEGVKFSEPDGAFYLFLDISSINKDSVKFCENLLQKKSLALVPGKAFGCDGFVRISYAASEENIIEGIKRLKEYIENESI